MNGLLLFAAGWFCGIASVFGAVAWAYRNGVRGL